MLGMQLTALHGEPQRAWTDADQLGCFREIHPACSGLARLCPPQKFDRGPGVASGRNYGIIAAC